MSLVARWMMVSLMHPPPKDVYKRQVVKGFLNLLPGHGIQVLAVVFRENVAVFAPLVAFVRYVPLKGKIFRCV